MAKSVQSERRHKRDAILLAVSIAAACGVIAGSHGIIQPAVTHGAGGKSRMRVAVPQATVIPLSAAFTFGGFAGSSTENVFAEYVLHARPGPTTAPIGIASWVSPELAVAPEVARSLQDAGTRRPRLAGNVPLPPRRPAVTGRDEAKAPAAEELALPVPAASRQAGGMLSTLRGLSATLAIPRLIPTREALLGAAIAVKTRIGGLVSGS